MSAEINNWRNNIPIGSKIVIDDKSELYIFYGYNVDQSIASCFPAKSTCMIDKMIYVPIKAILSIHKCNSTLLEKEMENKLKI